VGGKVNYAFGNKQTFFQEGLVIRMQLTVGLGIGNLAPLEFKPEIWILFLDFQSFLW
jgi:hypothetical protein